MQTATYEDGGRAQSESEQPADSHRIHSDQKKGIPDLTAPATPPSTSRSVPVMKLADELSRNPAAAAMSSGVPTRPAADRLIIDLITVPELPLTSWVPMVVEMTPGLIELTRAPRCPQADAAAATRRWLARLAKP